MVSHTKMLKARITNFNEDTSEGQTDILVFFIISFKTKRRCESKSFSFKLNYYFVKKHLSNRLKRYQMIVMFFFVYERILINYCFHGVYYNGLKAVFFLSFLVSSTNFLTERCVHVCVSSHHVHVFAVLNFYMS